MWICIFSGRQRTEYAMCVLSKLPITANARIKTNTYQQKRRNEIFKSLLLEYQNLNEQNIKMNECSCLRPLGAAPLFYRNCPIISIFALSILYRQFVRYAMACFNALSPVIVEHSVSHIDYYCYYIIIVFTWNLLTRISIKQFMYI